MAGRPIEDFEAAVGVLDDGGAAFHPVAVIDVEHAADVTDLGFVDMAADHPVHAAPPRLVGDRLFEVVDEFRTFLTLTFIKADRLQ
jgi:hypothetical protein